MSKTEGMIFSIQRFCVNDGPGIRTTVFFKGCPLHCIWCHNPESKSARPELFYDSSKCIACGQCAAVCPEYCHEVSDGIHRFDRGSCTACGICTRGCFTKALELVGQSVTVGELLAKVMRDRQFYEKSGGGITVSGGEPMMQFAFVKALLQAAKEQGIHTCMETCGYAPAEHYREIAPHVDLFLFDWKMTDPDAHRFFTGMDNRLIRENLLMLDRMGADIILRCPLIPGCNDEAAHLSGIAALANQLQNVQEIQIEPYHPLGSSKSDMLGKSYPLKDLTFPSEEQVTDWIQTIQCKTAVPVRRA